MPNPRCDFITHRESQLGIRFESCPERIGIHFKGNAVISSTCQKPTNVQIGELRNSKLSILFNMHKLMEQESMSERLMRDNDIPECNCSHRPEVGQVPET